MATQDLDWLFTNRVIDFAVSLQLFELALVLVAPQSRCQLHRKRESAEALQAHPERRRNTNNMAAV